MLQGVSGPVGNSGHGAAAAEAHESGGDGSYGASYGVVSSIPGGFNEEEKGRSEEGERNSGGNRWPRQETLALLKIRSDMDVAFRDSSLKGPLWEEVSRKLAELGYHRSSKKCKEKFENVYKYHKRTKDGRTSKPEGKTYRFFDQLEALESHSSPPLPLQMKSQAPMAATPMAVAMPASTNNPPIVSQVTVSSMLPHPVTVSQNNVRPIINPPNPLPSPPPPPQSQPQAQPQSQPQPTVAINLANTSQGIGVPSSHPNVSGSPLSNSISTSSSTSSDEEPGRGRKRKRRWRDFFGRLMKEVVEKQEELQKKFLETLEKRERDRMMREEAWRVQEMAKMNREHDLLVQERSMAAAKDAAVIAFLQKIAEQQNPQNPNATAQLTQMQMQVQQTPLPPPPPQPQQPAAAAVVPQQQPIPTPAPPIVNMDTQKVTDNGGENVVSPSPSRWPKAEIQALISLRTTLDTKYQENGPKGPLWEEISAAMRKLGYNRNAKRCKEKWENINKYYKKVKESNKKRPEDAKTCPYFHQLEAIYKERAKTDGSFNPGFAMKPENPMVPIMVRPEQQWPLAQEHHRPDMAVDGHESENIDDDDTGDDDEEEDDGEGYEIVTNKPSSMGTVE